jgi:hypothetical protein
MNLHERIALVYFAYLIAVAIITRRRVLVVISTSLAAIGAVIVTARAGGAWRIWWPAVTILAGYWASGQTFDRPMPAFERWLMQLDDRLLKQSGLLERLGRAPRIVLEYLEGLYFGCFLVVPGGVLVLLWRGHADAIWAYWTAVIIAEFGAFAMLPWIQTRPPWAIEPPGPVARRTLVMGRAARSLVDRATIRVNTFPSGHAAASLAAALTVLDADRVSGVFFLVAAISIAVAAVVGRYHYTADAITGGLLAVAAWVAARAWA